METEEVVVVQFAPGVTRKQVDGVVGWLRSVLHCPVTNLFIRNHDPKTNVVRIALKNGKDVRVTHTDIVLLLCTHTNVHSVR